MRQEISHIDIGTKRLEIVWYGPPPDEALTLVFLHEGLGCVDMWRQFPYKLASATGCGAMVYSRLGYGRSDACALPRPVSFMHEEGLNILPGLLEKTKIKECIIIGHSDGGSIGIIYAGGTTALPLRGLITEGEDDPYGSPSQLEAISKQSAGKTESLMLPKCGHSPHIDRRNATFQAMKDFVSDNMSLCNS